MRVSVALALCCLCTLSFAADPAHASIRKTTNIPAEELGSALQTVAKDYDFQVLYRTEIVKDLRTQGAVGSLTSDEALGKVLKGTGLTYKYLDSNTVTILPAPGGAAAGAADQSPSDSSNGGGKKSSQDFRVAQVDQGKGSNPSSVGPQTSQENSRSPSTGLEEIIVTAQKREESLLNVPMSVTALSGDQLARSQSFRMEDFVGQIPGVSLIDNGGLGSQVVIRGITSGYAPVNNAAATYIDETPYTFPGLFAQQYEVSPNIDTFDMQRIEVLRGPQGTLYGADSVSGVLKYVTNAPDPSGFSAVVQSSGSSVYNGGGVGFDVHGMINVPLASDLALRVVGYQNYYPGFVDDPSRGLEDTNGSHYSGGRASLLYQPTSDFSIRLNAIYQDRSWNDYPDEDVHPGTLTPVYGNLIQEKLINNFGHTTTQIYNLTANWDAGFAHLLSTTSYYALNPTSVAGSSQLTSYVKSVVPGSIGGGGPATNPHGAWTQEFRLTSSDTRAVRWQAGAYFTNEHTNEFEGFCPIAAGTQTLQCNSSVNLGKFYIPTHYREYAGFVNVDYFIVPTLDISVGGRYSADDQSFHEIGTGLLGGNENFGETSSENVFTYSGDVRWHVTPSSMLYARVASGFAPGGPNDVFTGSTLPLTYGSSTTVSYEAGVKSSMLDNRLTAEISAFDVYWHNIQIIARINGLAGIVSGGAAQSEGVEWNFSYVPLSGLRLNLNGAYTDAHLTEATPASVGGQVGNRLPGSSLWEGSASADYERPIFGSYSAFAGLNWRFSGNRFADFIVGSPRQEMPSFQMFDLRAGIETRPWSLTLYVKNLSNKIAINYVLPETSSGGFGPLDASLYTPRTVGVTIMARY